jgi:hypothetical protein
MAKGGFFDSMLSGLFGDAARPDDDRPALGVPMLAHWLPYRSYDPKTGIFYNSASRGFVIEAAPMVGADERTAEIITQFLSEGIPAPGCIQFHQWMSPRVGGAEQMVSAALCRTRRLRTDGQAPGRFPERRRMAVALEGRALLPAPSPCGDLLFDARKLVGVR